MKIKIPSFLIVLFFTAQLVSAQTYNIYTIVDTTGAIGFSGDGNQATVAEVDNPIHSVPDKLGDLYIADNINHRIREITINGVINTVVGTGVAGNTGNGGQATNAELNTPVALAIDDSGNLYICDRGACVIRKVYTSGIIITVAGNGSVGFSGDGGPATAAKLGEPRGVAVDDSGNIFIADFANSCIRKVDKKSDTITTVAGMGYVFGYSGDNGPATAAKLDYAAQLALGDSGDIYIDDLDNNVIRKVNSKGIISTFAGNGTAGVSGENVPATQAELDEPLGVAVDKAGNVYITDYLSQEVRKVNTAGIITTIAGTGATGHTGDGGPALSATMYSAAGINLDTLGNLYISELASPGNNDIRELKPCTVPLIYSPSQSLCYGQSVPLVVSGGSTYNWSPSTGLNTTTGDSVIANPTATVTYTVMASNSSGCSVTKNIVVDVIPSPNTPSFSQHNDTLVSSSEHDNQWYRNDTLLKDDTSQYLIITMLGDYWVVVANEVNGCSTSSDTMNISSLTEINQLTVESGQLTVYPNPFNNQLTITSNQLPIDEIDITNVLGQMVFVSSNILGNKNTIDMSGFPNGMYFITVITVTGREVVKVVKQ